MIASNFRRYADALIRQMELDLAPVAATEPATRAAWWTWLMQSGITQALPKLCTPAWLQATRAAAKHFALAVKAALKSLF